ncbi:nicotinamide-nucleotide adenylyltransferase, NadR type [Actinokineospora alba]|uniref:Nicotinamide-nucleotide adenylyltransferase, NadR type n=1 Tax=Actinokineospora alba TaxID=504798 RepID=A0A1H0G5Z7_9PSEU|nr:AAA family ATPase [Actinokineospora alba]TDP69777.1 NadR type nicotinamide-nucleotide adenylyltransferase [Actinokineospora alba]SDI08976.1 nicotinamide-nucleotide adenylyltransferase, NadR type [Actinokineospora alba]SDO02280.1 nicotinamide-nucleotide adenylyltransferase, NadR type [Actinokineospora alba]
MTYRHALVLGKFYPPHAGHHHLIRSAARAAERTTVAVLGSSVESLSIADRVRWIAAEHAGDRGVAVLGDLDDHPVDFHDDAVWDLHVGVIRSVLARRAIADGDPSGAPVDAVFTSEDYGAELAARLDAKHVLVDLDRVRFPVSGTAVRADPVGQWRFLAPATRAGLAVRIVVVGAESTGTTTLSKALAEHYGAPWVPEHGRLHTEEKLAAAIALTGPDATLESLVWTLGDFIDVARRQAVAEDAAATGPVLVCDNDPWAATVWGERYLGGEHPEIMAAVGDRRPALYLLTDHVGVPFEQDGWRDGEHLREWMTARFVRALRARGVPWVLLTGDHEHRLSQAITACDAEIERRYTFADPL